MYKSEDIELTQFVRFSLYSLLAHFYADVPSSSIFDVSAKLITDDNFDQACKFHKEYALCRDQLTLIDEKYRQSSVKLVSQQYNRLFIGVTEGLVNPYASWHLTGVMLSTPLAKIRQDLIRLGFVKQDNNKQPEDHMSNLLETMALLVDDSDTSNPAMMQQQADFYFKHIANWASGFIQQIKTNSEQQNIYHNIALLTEIFLKSEKNYLFQYISKDTINIKINSLNDFQDIKT